MAVLPNGCISYMYDTSALLQPIVYRIEDRVEKKIGTIYYPAPGLLYDTSSYYVSAYDIDSCKVFDVYAAAQQHVDQGMAMTLFSCSTIPAGLYPWKDGRTDKMTTRDLNICWNYAHYKGIKSIYYIRTYTDDQEEIGSNACESACI